MAATPVRLFALASALSVVLTPQLTTFANIGLKTHSQNGIHGKIADVEDDIQKIEDEHELKMRQILEICKSLKGEENSKCHKAAYYLGPEQFSKLGQAAVSASPKAISGFASACKEQIPDLLKSPGSAKFPNAPETTELFRGMYIVSGQVDSQNSYGALLRASYYCYMRNLPKKGMESLGAQIIEPDR